MRDATADRFERLRDHPRFEVVMAKTIATPAGFQRGIALAAYLLSLWVLGLGVVFLVMFFPFGFIFVLVSGLVSVAFRRVYREAVAYEAAPIVPSPRLVVRTRTHLSMAGHDVSTRYFVTLMGPRGGRTEHPADGTVVGQLVEDDIGVAFLKRNRLVAFDRFEV